MATNRDFRYTDEEWDDNLVLHVGDPRGVSMSVRGHLGHVVAIYIPASNARELRDWLSAAIDRECVP